MLKKIITAIISLIVISSCGNKISKSKTITEEIPQVECVAIDLGLPSGTLWAESNIGASSCEDPGYFFYWGDAKPFETGMRYKYVNDAFYDGGDCQYLKYVTSGEYGEIDGLTELVSSDDAAAVLVGNGWEMPSIEDINELFQFCTQKFEIQNNQEGISFVGPNGESIFLPYHKRTGFIGAMPFGDPVYDPIYWSKNLAANSNWEGYSFFNDQFACGIEIKTIYHTEEDKETIAIKDFYYRTAPGFIRPVKHL